MVTNRLGDVLAYTTGYEAVAGEAGILDGENPNLTRYVFADARARLFFTDWENVADEQAFDLWLGPSIENSQWLTAELAPIAGPDLTRRLNRHVVPKRGVLRLDHPSGHRLRLRRETFDIPADDQQLVIFLPADDQTAQVVDQLRSRVHGRLRSIS